MERSSFFNAILSGETYDRVYTAEDYARYFSSFIGNGVFPTPSMNLQAIADGTSMNITLKAGKGWINGYFYENTDDLTLNLAVADGVLNRIDKVVLRLDFINREIKAYVKKGTFSSSPVAPSLVRSSDMYELGLADIKVNKGVTKISQADITDLRHNNNYCGLVAGVLQQIDTTDLFAQFQSTFDIWFQHVKGQLSTDAAGNLQNQIDVWNDFKQNGGKLFNSLEFKNFNNSVDQILTTKGALGIKARTKGIVVDEVNNALRPDSESMDTMTIGTSAYGFKDFILAGGVSVKDTLNGKGTYSSGTWTPVLYTSGSGSSTITASTTGSHWVKIGNLVIASFTIIVSSYNTEWSSQTILIKGVPMVRDLNKVAFGTVLSHYGIINTTGDTIYLKGHGTSGGAYWVERSGVGMSATGAIQLGWCNQSFGLSGVLFYQV